MGLKSKLTLGRKMALGRQFYFVPHRVQNRFCDKAARLAVLCQLFGRSHSEEDVGARLVKLLGLWRRRVRSFAAGGLILPPAERFKLLNCCCSMAWMRAVEKDSDCRLPRPPSPLPCRRSRVCPFCYAAGVAAHYDKLSAWLDRQSGSVRLLRFSSLGVLPDVPDFWELFAEQHQLVNREVRELDAEAALVRITAAPAPSGAGVGAWAVRRSALVVVPRGAAGVGALLRGNDNKSRRKLVGLVGAVDRYPVGLLRSDRTGDVLRFLSARVRAVKTLGAWYGPVETVSRRFKGSAQPL